MTKIEQVIRGLQLCRAWADNPEVSQGHDTIYCSDGPAALDMEAAGWHWDEEFDCWAIFV